MHLDKSKQFQYESHYNSKTVMQDFCRCTSSLQPAIRHHTMEQRAFIAEWEASL